MVFRNCIPGHVQGTADQFLGSCSLIEVVSTDMKNLMFGVLAENLKQHIWQYCHID